MTSHVQTNSVFEPEHTALGLELGSTRIKAVLIDRAHRTIAFGSYQWENQLENGIWTYSLEAVRIGVQACFADLCRDVERRYGQPLNRVGVLGVSAMMHGYLPFDAQGRQLAPFRTWRNTTTGQAAQILSELFSVNIPQRWSIAHLYQAILNQEEHISHIAHLTTLAGYIHWKLTGRWVLGIGDASGVFPIGDGQGDYDPAMVKKFDDLISCVEHPWSLRDILPKVLLAGEPAGTLTQDGARFLDPTGTLQPGILCVPPEGDAGTGMTATNAVRLQTGNVSAGTSDFAMVVTGHSLGLHREIDMVTTPAGLPVAMVHCNNCTSDINAWVELFSQFADAIGAPQSKQALYTLLFQKAMEGSTDGGGLMNYNYLSGEGVTDIDAGCPVFLRTPDADFSLPNFMRTQLMSTLATLKIGLDILHEEEHVPVLRLCAHGGFFKTPEVGQRILSAAAGAPVTVMETAGEGGPYGMALLGAFFLWRDEWESLEDYLDHKVFADARSFTLQASEEECAGFRQFMARYKAAFPVERTAVQML